MEIVNIMRHKMKKSMGNPSGTKVMVAVNKLSARMENIMEGGENTTSMEPSRAKQYGRMGSRSR